MGGVSWSGRSIELMFHNFLKIILLQRVISRAAHILRTSIAQMKFIRCRLTCLSTIDSECERVAVIPVTCLWSYFGQSIYIVHSSVGYTQRGEIPNLKHS